MPSPEYLPHQPLEAIRPPLAPEQVAEIGDMGIIAAQYAQDLAQRSEGMASAADIRRMSPDDQRKLGRNLDLNAEIARQQQERQKRWNGEV